MRGPRRHGRLGQRGERGSALVELTWLGLLLMVPLVYVVVAVLDVQRGAYAVTAASRAAARAYSLAPSEGVGRSRAEAAARQALADQGMAREGFRLRVGCRPAGGCLQPGGVITVRVDTQVTLPLLPDVLGGGRPAIRLDATQRVPYGTYREGR